MNEILLDEALEALSEDEFISCAEAVAQLWEDESKGKEKLNNGKGKTNL